MKRVFLQDIFSSIKLEDTNILVGKDLKNIFYEFPPQKIKKNIYENPFLQKSLIEELAYINSLNDEFDRIDMNHQFFIGELYTPEELVTTLKMVYENIMPIVDKNQRLVGYSVSNASSTARSMIKELYDERKISHFITHFLSLTEKNYLGIEEKGFWKAEKVIIPQECKLDIYDDSFYKVIESDLKYAGIYSFLVNKFNIEVLEKDYYIQKLIELEKSVYICKFEGEKLLNVFIK